MDFFGEVLFDVVDDERRDFKITENLALQNSRALDA